MTTETNDQPLQSAGPLFTDPNARYRSVLNDPSCSHGVVSQQAAAANMNQVPNGYGYSIDNNQIATSESDKTYHCAKSSAVVTLANNIVSTPAAFVSSITVPVGWRRIHSKGIIIYISPSNTVLNSLDQVKIYLQTQGTCKCGLECPLHCEHVFNFDAKVMTKPMSGINTMTNLCNHKRKMTFNNSENRFSKYSFEMAENLKKRKLCGAQQQQYSFASYEGERAGKENFSQVSNSHQMQWSDQSTVPSQMRFSSQETSAMLNPQSPESMLNSQGPQTMSQSMQQMVQNIQISPILNQSSTVMSNSQGSIMSDSQNIMMSNLQGTVMPNSQGIVMPNPQGTMIPNTQSSSTGLGNPRVFHYPNHSYQQDLGYEQSYRNGYRYNSSQCRSHETTLQPDSSCQPHEQYQSDMVSQDYYQKNTQSESLYQQEQMQYNNYDSQRTQGSCRFNCSSHCGHYCNSGEQQNPSYAHLINPYQQQLLSQSLRPTETTNHEYYPEMYQEQNNYTDSYQDNRNNPRHEYPSQYEYEPKSQSQCHHIMDCNLKNTMPTSTNNQSPVEAPQIRPQAPQVRLLQQQVNTQNVQQAVIKPSRPQHRSTPPWQLNKIHQSSNQKISQNQIPHQQISQESPKQIFEDRVPPIHHHVPQVSRIEEKTRKPFKQAPKSVSSGRKSKSPTEEDNYPSFLDDPTGYLAQQTALLNNTISTNSFSPLSPPTRPQRQEKLRYTTNVTTMASGRTVSSNTITSVLAGRANTSVVTVNTSEDQVIPPNQQHPVTSKTPLEMVQSVVSSIQVPTSSEKSNIQPSHILLTSNGQLIMASAKLQTPNTSQVISTVQQQVQPTVLVNTLHGTQGTLLLQPGNVMTVDQVQVPQLAVATGNMDNSGAFSPRGSNLLSPPDSKRKTISAKKRKSPQISPNQNSSSVLLQPQQQNFNQPVVQTLILPNKTAQYGSQQLITNVIQPVSLVHNLPAIQQFIVPTNLGNVVMADNTILQDAVQLNVITPYANNGQNILPTGMVLRTSQNQQRPQQSNQFIVNSVGQLSPILANLNPNQPQNQNRNQQQNDYNIHVVPCSIQQNQENTTVVQQNTTIVQQQMTMVSGQQGNEQGNLIINEKQGQNYIIADNKQQGFILSPKDKQQSGGTHFILNNMNSEKQSQSFIITSPTSSDKQLCGNFILEKTNSSGNFIITTTNSDKSSKFAKHSVSTQTAAGQQVLQISSTPALLVATNRNAYVGSPPDTTTLSPVSGQSPSAKPEMPSSSVTTELDAALSPSSLSEMQNRLPMVHCISSSNVVDWSDNSADERKTISSASDSPNMYSIEHSFPR